MKMEFINSTVRHLSDSGRDKSKDARRAEFIHRHLSPKRKDMEGRHLKKLKYWRKVFTLKDDRK